MRRIVGKAVPAQAGDFRLLSRAAVEAIRELPERRPVLRLVVPWLGFPSGEVRYQREERAAGRTKYPVSRMVGLAADSVTSFSAAPLRFATWLGLAGVVVCGLLVVAAPSWRTCSARPCPAGPRSTSRCCSSAPCSCSASACSASTSAASTPPCRAGRRTSWRPTPPTTPGAPIQAIMQDRLGPLHTGPWGLLQTFADAIKLLGKEDIRARLTDKWFFLAAPSIVFSPMLASYVVIPFAPDIVGADLSVGLLYLTTLGSMTVLGIVIAGWASNNKYSLIGGLRSAGQLISYEVPQILSLVTVVLVVGTLSMVGIANSQPGWQMNFLILPFAFVTYFIAGLAETNRNPFDLPEAESELVAGFLTEYSGMRWADLLPR